MILIGCREYPIANSDSTYGIFIICIENHEYYTGYNSLAIRLDDNGKPVKCEVQGGRK